MKIFTKLWNLLVKWLVGPRSERNRKPTPMKGTRRDSDPVITSSRLVKIEKPEKERYSAFQEQFPTGLFHSDQSRADLSDRIFGVSHQVDFGISAERQAIKQFCEERGIVELVHFTHVDNLRTITEFGLLSREELEKRGIHYKFNDQNRLEGMLNAVCLSISFPNYKMFYKYLKQSGQHNFVVISLDVAVLWELECLFCPTNAASNLCKPLRNHETLKGLPALKEMFAENPLSKKHVSRAELKIPDHYTTDPQAEVLCLEPISPTYIRAIYHNHCPNIEDKVPPEWRWRVMPNEEFFGRRKDYKYWQSIASGIEV